MHKNHNKTTEYGPYGQIQHKDRYSRIYKKQKSSNYESNVSQVIYQQMYNINLKNMIEIHTQMQARTAGSRGGRAGEARGGRRVGTGRRAAHLTWSRRPESRTRAQLAGARAVAADLDPDARGWRRGWGGGGVV